MPGIRHRVQDFRQTFITGSSACACGIALALSLAIVGCGSRFDRGTLPQQLSDDEFWTLVRSVSEAPGSFSHSDNLVSNEILIPHSIRQLRARGGVYIGVGPEQNFSYIARIEPAMAFIIDIRQENRNLHLLYKALFELSADRADFVARLFSRPRPAGLGTTAGAGEIFSRYESVAPSPELYSRNGALLRERLLTAHGLPLSSADLAWIDRVFKAFYDDGPAIQFWGSREKEAVPSYRVLMTAKDFRGQSRSFLATEEGFTFVKDLHARNMIVPVVGDFGGPKAINGVGEYVRARSDVVRAFYGSNVGVYLNKQQMRGFCRNLAGLPAARDAWFIERDGVRSLTSKLKGCPAQAE